MGELLSGGEGQFRTQGTGAVGTAPSVSEALDVDLDAYLDRELFVGPQVEADVEPESSASGSMRALLDLAEAEADWLETLPAPAAAPVEQKREPAEPPVVIPEWMREDPGTETTVPPKASATETAAHVLHESAVAGLPWGSAAGTDVSGMPMTPWSVPVEEPSGGLLPGIPTPPPVAAVPVAPWAPPGAVPMAPYPVQPWGHAVAAPAEPRRIAGMRPGAFLGAAAVGALAAGLLVVAGLHFHGGTGARPASTVSEAQHGAAQATATSATDARSPGAAGVSVNPGAQPPGAVGPIQPTVASPVADVIQPMAPVIPAETIQPAPPEPVTTAAAPAPGTELQQAAASSSGTVLSSAQDLQGAANTLRAAQPTAPAASTTTLTSGKAPRAKVPTKSRVTTVTQDTATAEEESPSSELTFNDSESTDTEATEAPGTKVAVSSAQARPPGKYADLDEDFARELGFTEDAESKAEASTGSQRTVYIPPAPDAKEHLTPDDVKQVVVTNQPAITACIRQHAKGTPVEGGGRFLVKWSVLPSGDTAQVGMDTDTLRATPLARCIEDVVRRWKFPAHRVRMAEPIRFPFVF